MIYVITIAAIILGVALDQYTKFLAIEHLQNSPIVLIKDVFELRYLENRGAAFGMLQDQQFFFLVIGFVALFLMTYIYIRLPKERHYIPLRICLICLTIGAIGNMIDRIRLKYVVDFLYFKLIDFPIFNVADIFASVSTVFLVVLLLFYYKEEDIDQLFKRRK